MIDRKSWPSGPWDREPDRVEWRDDATGLVCLIVRNPLGALCGYVAVPDGHVYFQKRHGDIDDVSVHGGLTYSDFCQGDICHVPAPGESDHVWWLGFDCAHYADCVPAMMRCGLDGIYRDIEYVKDECRYLAAQIAGATT